MPHKNPSDDTINGGPPCVHAYKEITRSQKKPVRPCQGSVDCRRSARRSGQDDVHNRQFAMEQEDYGNTKTSGMHCMLGSATLSQLSFPRAVEL